jgi:murein DD-endopeptidase MepM/ murein hydrolase activator NlpD
LRIDNDMSASTLGRASFLCSFAIVLGCSGESVPPAAKPPAASASDHVVAPKDSVRKTTVTELATTATTVAAVSSNTPAHETSLPTASIPATTDAELAALHAQIGIPVFGVLPAQLRDTYFEPRTGHAHEALDIPAPRGTPVVSAAPGRLLKIFESKAGGHMVYAADESDRFILMYAHLDSYAPGLKEGMQLVRGQSLGSVGTSGNAPPDVPHLHFAISRGTPSKKWWAGTPINPYPLLAR